MEWRGGLMSHGQFSLSGDLAGLPLVWGHSVGKEESCFLSQGSLQMWDSRAEPQVRATVNPTFGSDWGLVTLHARYAYTWSLPRGLI